MDGVGPDRTTSYGYDLLDRLVTLTQPEAEQVTASGAVTTFAPITKYTYDRVGRLTETVDPLGRVTTTEYDDASRKETLQLPSAPQVTGTSPNLTTVTERPTTITLRDTNGNVVSLTDANTNETKFSYDARNQLQTKTLPSISALGESVFTYTYDTAGNVTSETRPATNIAVGTAARKTTYLYDALHRLTLETRPTPGGVSTHSAPMTAFTYDDAGNKASVTDPEKRLTKYDYDAANRLVTITAPAVDKGGSATVTKYDYDRSDNRTLVKDAVNGDDDVVSEYDPLNRKIRDTFVTVQHFNVDDPEASPITAAAWMAYAYNDAGELTATTDRLGRTTDRDYDALGRLTKVTQPAVVGGTPTTVMQYDAIGNLRLVYDPLQSPAKSATNRTEYEYDKLDRRTIVRSAAPDIEQATVRPVVTTGYDHVGNVRTVTDPRQQLTRTDYNKQNLPTLVMQPDPGREPGGTAADHSPVLTTLTYDPSGNRIEEVATSVAISDGVSTTLMNYKTTTQFDNLDRPYKVTDWTGLVTETVYLADGLVESATQASGTAEARTTEYGYDGLARTRVVKRQRGNTAEGAPVYDITTTKYDAVGNLRELTDPAGNVTEFFYDRAYRKTGDVTLARVQPSGSPQPVSRAYQYDKQNNLRLVTDRNGRQTQYDYDGLDRRTTETWLGDTGNGYVATFQYDLAGNLKSAEDQYGETKHSSVGYDLDGLYRPKVVTTKLPGVAPTTVPARFDTQVGYSYDLSNNRVRSSVSVYSPTESKLVTQLTTAFVIDNLNRTLSIRQRGPTIFARAVNFDYHADGRVKATTRGSGQAAGDVLVGGVMSVDSLMGTSVSVFDATTGRLESLTHNDNKGNAEVKYEFGYDTYSRMNRYQESRGQTTFAAIDQRYTYDLTDQTTKAGNETFTFAANGNRNRGGYLTDRDNRLVNDPAYVYTYDAEGNRVSREALAVRNAFQGGVQMVDNAPVTSTGIWETNSTAGYGGSQRVGRAQIVNDYDGTYRASADASWTVSNLPAGQYDAYATWAGLGPTGAASVAFEVSTTYASNGTSTTSRSAQMNFQNAPPNDLPYDGVRWTKIGSVIITADATVRVQLSNLTEQFIAADAILFKPTGLDVARTTYEWDHQNRLTKVTNESAASTSSGGGWR